MEIIASIITSGLVTSAFLFLFQQSISAKLKQLELQFGSVIQYRQKNLDLVIKAYEDVWSGLVEIERLLRSITTQMNNGSFPELTPIHDAHFRFRQKMLLLPDNLCENTEGALKRLEENMNKFLATYQEYRKTAQEQGRKPNQQELDAVTNAIHLTINAFTNDMEALRKSFQSSLHTLVYGSTSPSAQ